MIVKVYSLINFIGIASFYPTSHYNLFYKNNYLYHYSYNYSYLLASIGLVYRAVGIDYRSIHTQSNLAIGDNIVRCVGGWLAAG